MVKQKELTLMPCPVAMRDDFQVMFFPQNDKGILASFDESECLILNLLLYKSKKHIIEKTSGRLESDKIFSLELFPDELCRVYGMDPAEIDSYEHLEDILRVISNKPIIIPHRISSDHGGLAVNNTNFIPQLNTVRLADKTIDRFLVALNTEILTLLLGNKKFFGLEDKEIFNTLDTKHSKSLYSIIVGMPQDVDMFMIPIDVLVTLMGIRNVTRYSAFNVLNGELLKDTIEKINRMTDVKITCNPFKEKLPGCRLQITKLQFDITRG